MKKLLAGMVASMMFVMLMGTTVFAAESPTTTTVKTALEQEAENLKSKITAVAATDADGMAFSLADPTEVSTGIMQWGKSEAKKLSSSAEVIAMADLSPSESSKNYKGSVTVRLSIGTVRADDNIHVYHYNETKNEWEDLNTISGSKVTVKNGQVIVTMTSFSPIMVVYVPKSASQSTVTPADTSQDSSQSGSQSESQTGSQGVSTDSVYNYTQGYNDGYEAGRNSVSQIDTSTSTNSSSKNGSSKNSSSKSSSSKSSSGTTRTSYTTVKTTTSSYNTSSTSPKTGASIPALPFLAMFALSGLLVCRKKAQN